MTNNCVDRWEVNRFGWRSLSSLTSAYSATLVALRQPKEYKLKIFVVCLPSNICYNSKSLVSERKPNICHKMTWSSAVRGTILIRIWATDLSLYFFFSVFMSVSWWRFFSSSLSIFKYLLNKLLCMYRFMILWILSWELKGLILSKSCKLYMNYFHHEWKLCPEK